ncbi:MAG: epsilon-lactone hydrolase [Aliidongia sp.]|nr:epsilon-lactone hydrolase [Aliidongia sp.]
MSWQNWVMSTLLRYRMKPLSKRKLDPAKLREVTAKPVRTARIPAGWWIRPVTEPFKGEWIERDGGDPGRTLLYLHGGGYFFCSPETHRPITLALAAKADARVLALDYRLAPEYPFPAAIEDAVAAYRHLVAEGTPAHRIVIGGDSAGGGLALATLLSLRAAGDEMPAGAILFSPWTDLAGTGETLVTNDKSDVMFYGEGLKAGAQYYLNLTPPTDPLASPLYADLGGLPPLFVQVSGSEVLLADSTRLVDKARAAGVSVEFEIWRKLPHVWQILTPFVPEARAALDKTGDFIRRVTV